MTDKITKRLERRIAVNIAGLPEPTERNLCHNAQNANPVHRGAFLKLIRWSIRTVSSNADSGSFITFAPTGYCAVDEGAESKFLRK